MITPHGDRLRFRSVVLAVGLLQLAHPVVHAQAVRPDVMAADGVVRASALAGNVLYLGGDFTWVGYPTGALAKSDATTGAPDPGFPRVADGGVVNVVIPDGAGGWFVGGSFTQIGGVARQNLAHVLANGSLAAWAPDPDGDVMTLLVRGSTLIVGGTYSSIGGQLRNNLAAVSTTGAGLATSWNPDVDGGVMALAGSATAVFAGGAFSNVGGTFHLGLASIDPTSGVPAATWAPQAFGLISTMALSDTTLYMGGVFTAISGPDTYSNLIAVGATTGAIHAWNPSPDNWVHDVSVPPSGGPVYVAGEFTAIGGAARQGLAAISPATGLAVTNWIPNSDGPVTRVLSAGKKVYVGGSFTNIGLAARLRVAALDSASAKATAWAPNANGEITAIGVSGSSVVLGGGFGTSSIGGVPRDRVAAIDVSTGRATSWNPGADGTVEAIAVQGGTVYLGGAFATVAGAALSYAAAVDLRSGALRAGWNANADGEVLAIAAGNGETWFGGLFTSIGGQPRNAAAALDTATGTATAWNPSPGPPGGAVVTSLVMSGSTVFVGGGFSSIGGQPRVGVAAIGANGLALPWTANTPGVVHALAVSGTTLYMGGAFSEVGGQTRANIAAVNTATGTLLPLFHPGSSGTVLALAAVGDTLYAGGFFGTFGGVPRVSVAAVTATGDMTSWRVDSPVVIYTLAATRANVCMGGDFVSAGTSGQPNFAIAGVGTVATGVDDAPLATRTARVDAVEPNPAARAARVRFTLPSGGAVTLDVLDVSGRRVATLMNGKWLTAGEHEARLESAALAPGLYLVRLRAGASSHTTKFVRIE
ncbi:MAG: T9SS type A sorting domain-containing protein [Candidatus Eisenbacteria bacterium]